jgi:hypothetical protein
MSNLTIIPSFPFCKLSHEYLRFSIDLVGSLMSKVNFKASQDNISLFKIILPQAYDLSSLCYTMFQYPQRT